MRATGMPNGLSGVGYGPEDVAALVDRTYPQQRLLTNAPCPVDRDDLTALFRDALRYW